MNRPRDWGRTCWDLTSMIPSQTPASLEDAIRLAAKSTKLTLKIDQQDSKLKNQTAWVDILLLKIVLNFCEKGENKQRYLPLKFILFFFLFFNFVLFSAPEVPQDAVWSLLFPCLGAGEKEVWTSWMEYPVWVQWIWPAYQLASDVGKSTVVEYFRTTL